MRVVTATGSRAVSRTFLSPSLFAVLLAVLSYYLRYYLQYYLQTVRWLPWPAVVVVVAVVLLPTGDSFPYSIPSPTFSAVSRDISTYYPVSQDSQNVRQVRLLKQQQSDSTVVLYCTDCTTTTTLSCCLLRLTQGADFLSFRPLLLCRCYLSPTRLLPIPPRSRLETFRRHPLQTRSARLLLSPVHRPPRFRRLPRLQGPASGREPLQPLPPRRRLSP